ncbi:MAG: PHP domain-containing protein [Melioribacteraceae bacterium]|nr:PHP domain-containing protein [Melioribacteraceae bacterium]MCF8264546.1 PHP domain-containing protein [Melioribacteraceae bacterium]
MKKEIAKILDEMSNIFEFNGENQFKVNAFRNGSRTISRLENDIEDMIQDGSIKNVKGIGKGILSVIDEYFEKNVSNDYEQLKSTIPDGILDMFDVRGIGAKKIRLLHDELGITNLDQLEKACRKNKLAELKGFGSSTQEKILNEVIRIKKSQGMLHLHRALELGKKLQSKFEDFDSVKAVFITGDLRRNMEIVSSVDFVILVNDRKVFEVELAKLHEYNKLDSNEYYKVIRFVYGFTKTVYLFVTSEKEYLGNLKFLTTGSNEFLEKIGYEKAKFWEHEEHQILEKLQIGIKSPEMREVESLESSEEHFKDSDLEENVLNGLLHFHTTASDGNNTLVEMINEAKAHGFNYYAVCDHSKSAFYANGLTEDRILLQKKELRKLADSKNENIFQGIESDILKDGSLDYSDDFLANLDFVVASIHSIFTLSEDEMTARVIKAIENPFTDVFAHPTGRLLLSRDPYKINIKKVLEACSQNDVAIEINANPHRLDLDWRWIMYAREQNCKFAINPDAHSTHGIEDVKYGIMIARKAGLTSAEVINCYSAEKFKKYLNRKTKRNFD